MRRDVKASSVGSTNGSGRRAFVILGACGRSKGSGASTFKLLGLFTAAIAALLVFAGPAAAVPYFEAGIFANNPSNPGGPGNPKGSGAANGQLNNPGQVAVNEGSGKVYVADTDNNRVQAFKPTATAAGYESQVAITGPTGLAVDQTTGDVYVANATGISKFTSTLLPITVGWTNPAVTGALAVDPVSGDLLVADTAGNQILRFDSNGAADATMPSFAAERPFSVAANSVGEIFVVTSTGDVINTCDASSTVRRFNAEGTELGTVGESLLAPGAVAVDLDDDGIMVAAPVNQYLCGATRPAVAFFDSTGEKPNR